MFLTLVYLKNKKPKKKKQKTNFIYKVKLKPRIMERGETSGEQGKRLGQSQYHILNTGRCWFLLASPGWLEHSALWQTQPNTKSSPAQTPISAMAKEDPSPRNLLLYLAGLVPSRGRALTPCQSPRLFPQFIGIRPYDILESLFLPCLILNWKRTGEKSAQD